MRGVETRIARAIGSWKKESPGNSSRGAQRTQDKVATGGSNAWRRSKDSLRKTGPLHRSCQMTKYEHKVPLMAGYWCLDKILNSLLEFSSSLSDGEYVIISYLKQEQVLKPNPNPEADNTQLTIKTTALDFLNDQYADITTDNLLHPW